MSQREQARLQVLNSLLAEHMTMEQASTLMGVSTRHTRRILAAYRKEGAAALAHGHRGRRAPNAAPVVGQSHRIAALFSWVTTNARLPCVRAPGMRSVSPLSSMRSRWCGGICGSPLRLYPHRRPSLMWRKSHCRCSIALWIALPTQLERLYICMLRLLQCTKSSTRAVTLCCCSA